LSCVALVATSTVSPPGFADYRGPGTQPGEITVKQILDKPHDEQVVVLQGTIVRQEKKDRYVFTDGTGEIRVEIAAKKFPAEPVVPTTRVQIHGEVEKDFLRTPTIDVRQITIVPG
jgi:uncharacterized protein (TIGR00156 family)